MANNNFHENRGGSQWKDVKVGNSSKQELAKTVEQIRSQVKEERRIFSVSTSSLVGKSKF